MRSLIAAAIAGSVALAGLAGVAHASATIDLIWEFTGTTEIDDSGPQVIQLNVILTAGPSGSQGGAVSVDFSAIGADALVVGSNTPLNTPSRGADTPLPIEMEFPQIRETRVELINSVCFCDLGIGTGLEAGQSHQLGYVTFNIFELPVGRWEIRSVADGSSDGVFDGQGDLILPKTEVTANSAFLNIGIAPPKLPGGIRNRRR